MSIDLLGTDLDDFLSLASDFDVPVDPTSNVRILQHFQTITSLTLGSTKCRDVMHSFVAQKARQYPYLMHIVLAVSAAHLKRLHDNIYLHNLRLKYSIAEAAHWQTGLQLYQEELSNAKPDFDATIATTFLTVIFTFSLDDEIPSDAYMGDNNDKFSHAINPMAATSGFRALRDVFGEFMYSSIWRSVLRGSDDDYGTFSNGDQIGIDGLPPAFVDLCDFDASTNSKNNEYYYIVRLLTPLFLLEPNFENFTKLMAFAGRAWPAFRPLVHRKDPRGLLLLAYWFALLKQVDQWWVMQRGKTECMAIVNYLSQLEDPKINALLPFPASFGRADLSYIWDAPNTESDTGAVFDRYFQKAITRTTPHQYEVSLLDDP